MTGYATTAATSSNVVTMAWTTWASTTNDALWETWTVASGAATTYNTDTYARPLSAVPTRSKPRGGIVSLEEYRQRLESKKRKARGLDLLRFLLTPEQRADLDLYGSVRFRGSLGGLYETGLLRCDVVHKLAPDGTPIKRLGVCQTGRGYVEEDRLAAIILAFQHEEAAACMAAVDHTSLITPADRDRIRTRRFHKSKNAHYDGRKSRRRTG